MCVQEQFQKKDGTPWTTIEFQSNIKQCQCETNHPEISQKSYKIVLDAFNGQVL